MIRNRTIAKVFRQFSLIEEWGSGYQRIINACNEHNYPMPEWLEIGPVLRVTFVPHSITTQGHTQLKQSERPTNVPANVPINKRQQWFINQLKQGIQCNPTSIVTKWNVVAKTAKRDISDLQKKNIVTFIGAAKTGTYQLLSEQIPKKTS